MLFWRTEEHLPPLQMEGLDEHTTLLHIIQNTLSLALNETLTSVITYMNSHLSVICEGTVH